MHLLKSLTALVGKSICWPNLKTNIIPLTHAAFLQALNDALAMDGWPEDDHAIPFIPPDTSKLGHLNKQPDWISTASKRPREVYENSVLQSVNLLENSHVLKKLKSSHGSALS
ncbi:hypothetical protein SCP_1503290 [Sparassis crispa]|uniref:Uncharacterized protein n=1 Tax=Sparassis crispa TaxID=139825 RepID=A0A401H4J6_9APHY|nr:hypothetical protein SCP_1503290 [Sparassis crispa]GBE89321.1 hypothetical protein SCP_1503290 [Sparassis crispa]